jgi:hypothetical protein
MPSPRTTALHGMVCSGFTSGFLAKRYHQRKTHMEELNIIYLQKGIPAAPESLFTGSEPVDACLCQASLAPILSGRICLGFRSGGMLEE